MKIRIDGAGETRQTIIGDCRISDTKFIQYPSKKFFIRYLFDDLVSTLAKDLHANAAADYDNVVMIQGGEGSGKSNLAYQIARAYDPGFQISDSYVYDMDGLKDRFRKGDYGHGIFWMDETSNIANNRDWQSQSNKDMISILETMRSKKFLFIGCIPHIERADLYIREFRMRYLITCMPMAFSSGRKERGYFELKKRNSEGKMQLVGYGEYDRIPEEHKAEYEKMKSDFQDRKIAALVGDSEGPGAKYKAKYESERKKAMRGMLELHNTGAYTDEELMVIFGFETKKSYQNALSKARNEE